MTTVRLRQKQQPWSRCFRASPVFFVFAPVIQLVVPLGDRVYRWIGAHREGFGRVFAVVFPWRDEAKFPGRLSQWVAAVMLVTVLAWNVQTIPTWRTAITEQFGWAHNARLPGEPVLRMLSLTQKWNMFAPYPRKRDSWLLVPD